MKKIILAMLATTALASPVMAAPKAAAKAAPAPVASTASSAFKAGDFMIRARALGVIPSEDGRVSNGDSVNIDDSVVPELDFTYFFTPNIAAELIAAVTPHDVTTSSGINAGSAWLLPPTLTLQYHFTNWSSAKPYLGAGVNYTHFYNEKPGSLVNAKYDDSFGAALQAGVDIPIQDNWYFNIDVKKVFISTDVKFSNGAVTADVDIDPWLVGVGIGYRF